MQEAFTIRGVIMGLFKGHRVGNFFFDFLKKVFREDDLKILLPLGENIILRNLVFTLF